MKCPKCNRDVIRALFAPDIPILLDPAPLTYVAVDEHHIYPEDGDRVFQSAALVAHAPLCTGEWRERAAAREAYKQSQSAKAGKGTKTKGAEGDPATD
jgi:hypothetical protein